MAQKRDTPGINAPGRRLNMTSTVKTSVSAKRQLAKKLVNEWRNTASDFDPDAYLKVICELFDVTPEEVSGDRRFPSHIKARHLWWACIREYGKWSYPFIGDYVDREHTTIMEGVRRAPIEIVRAIHEVVNE